MFVTGFGPFGAVADNPSAQLARSCGLPHVVLEVSFAAVEEFLAGYDPAGRRRLLLIGVSGGAASMRMETVARNEIGAAPDVRGVVAGPGPIDPRLPARLAGRLWSAPGLQADDPRWEIGTDAGTYLCNYVYFRALTVLPELEIGFLHVPAADKVPIEEQAARFQEILAALGR